MEIEQYIAYLLSEPNQLSCVRAGDLLEVSHDAVTRLLSNCHSTGKDLFDRVKGGLELTGGTLSVDDTVLDKPYSKPEINELVGFFWSGRHHKAVKGINLVVLFYTDASGMGMPVNFRLVDKQTTVTKHELFQQMYLEVCQWGLAPAWVSFDAWYASLDTLKFLRNQEVGILFGLAGNRIISSRPHEYEQIGQVEQLPEQGLFTHLKGFDYIQVFRTVDDKDHVRHYGIYPASQPEKPVGRALFKQLKQQHWKIETCFRALKQCCHVQQFFVRNRKAVENHIYAALRAFQRLSWMAHDHILANVYELRKKICKAAQQEFITSFA
jgi:hypothetical protein